MSRLPIRLRLTAAFAAAMAVVLLGIGLAVYLRFESDLDAGVDRSLRSRAGDLAAVVRGAGPGLPAAAGAGLIDADESFAQVLDTRGRVRDASAGLRERQLLGAAELRRASAATVTVDRASVFEPGDSVRVLATPVDSGGQRLIVVAGASLDDNKEALASLRLLMLAGGPLALLLASVAGYGVAAGALRPVDAMRQRAAEIGGERPGERLPVPPARDEIARLGETLNEMLERLDAVLARERAFVADASHELRTPLAILRGELELALHAGRSRAELEAALRSAAEEADRLSRLADDLLLLARLDRGQLPLRRESVDARELLATVSARFARRAHDAGRSLAVEVPPGVTVEGDRLRLEQAVTNMVDNALRHGIGAVRLSARELPGRVELRVTDEGPGIPSEMGDDAFERFARGPQARGGSGAGLGLAIVRAIAASHGGSAGAGRGSEGGGGAGPGAGGGASADVWIELPR